MEVGVSGVRVALGASVGAEMGATAKAGVLVGGVWAAEVQPIKPRHTRPMMDFCKGFSTLFLLGMIVPESEALSARRLDRLSIDSPLAYRQSLPGPPRICSDARQADSHEHRGGRAEAPARSRDGLLPSLLQEADHVVGDADRRVSRRSCCSNGVSL